VTDTLHGVATTDPYRWLEDQTSADTRAWIAAQNRFREQRMAALPGCEAIVARLRELLMVDARGTPVVRGNRYFFTRRAADQGYSAIFMREGPRLYYCALGAGTAEQLLFGEGLGSDMGMGASAGARSSRRAISRSRASRSWAASCGCATSRTSWRGSGASTSMAGRSASSGCRRSGR
jgi:hypothetical protein